MPKQSIYSATDDAPLLRPAGEADRWSRHDEEGRLLVAAIAPRSLLVVAPAFSRSVCVSPPRLSYLDSM